MLSADQFWNTGATWTALNNIKQLHLSDVPRVSDNLIVLGGVYRKNTVLLGTVVSTDDDENVNDMGKL